MARRLTFRWTREEVAGFIWDEANRQAHFEKHRVDFRMVLEVDWTHIKKAADLRRRYPTPRWVALAYCPPLDRVLVIVYARNNRIGRIVSVRIANEHEEAVFRA